MSWDEIIKGTNGNDVINGGSGDDFLQGKAGGDALNGGDGDDQLHGDSGDDYLRGGAGADLLHGGLGTDTAVYSGSIHEYSFSRDGENFFVNHSGGSGVDGNDRLISIERLVFADAVIDLTQNNAPIAFNDFASINEDAGSYSGSSVLANDFDWEGQSLTAAAGTFNGVYGTLVLNSNGTYTYTPYASTQSLALGQTVTDSFTYTVSDGSLSDTGTLTIAIAGRNDAPVANPDAATGHENQVLAIDVLANDTDVDNGAALTVTSASAPAGKGSASVVGNQVRFDPGSDFDHLAQGASEVVVISYSITDEHGATSSSTVSVTVTGTNDGPVANADSALGTENQILLIDALANDTDSDDGAVKSLVSASAPAGKGTASIVGGQIRFDPGAAFDHLALGASETILLSYTMQDEHGATSSSTVTVTITGTNDGPVANADSAATNENSPVVIAVLANDTDADDGAVLTVTSASAPAGKGSASVVGNQVRFDPGSDFDHLAQGASEVVVISYSITDEHGATSSSTATVTITGTNDGPVANADSAATGENSAVIVNVLANDSDADEGAVLTVTAASAPAGQGSASIVGNQVRFDPGSDFDHLAQGDSEIVTVSYTVSDEHGATSSSTVTITVTGSNDAPVAAADSATTDENAVVTVDVLANDSDVDDGAVLSVTAASAPAGQGSAAVVGDQVRFDPGSDFDYLNPGETAQVVVSYTIEDEHGAQSSSTVTVTVTGSSDVATWYIDNSAVGSSNEGTQANPFTSIAAFNAAQGAPGGPAEGETVYLLAGTGTYAEADGINLLDGQVLIGVSSGALRPTIVTTGSGNHGIELAADNSITGIDIGTTTGAGIADGNGTVGNLVISDVGKTGAGQIVDIDQGGTLDVKLNYTQSTGSTGGAVDLHGVGGTFTAMGWMDIAGVHTGGGIDITGSSLTFSLTSGGAVMNADATAGGVRFEGNSGSFISSGGMFDVSTRAGTALSFQDGGTVSFSGADNNISSHSGSAVIIRNTTSAGVTLESVSSNSGSATAIILDSAGSGGFTITGEGTAMSGGVIGKSGPDGSTSEGIGILIVNTSNVSLTNMAINSTANFGILGIDVTNFTLRDSTVGQFANGTSAALREGSISFTNLTGTALFEGNYIGGGRSDNLSIENSSGSLDLTIRDSALNQAVMGRTHADGEDSVFIQTSGTASLTAIVDGVEFQGARSDLLSIVALDASSQDLTITGNDFHNAQATVGGGILLTGGGAGSDIDVDFRVEDNSFTGASGTALTALYAQQAGEIRGNIEGNSFGTEGGGADGSGSLFGGGIFVGLEKTAGPGEASFTVSIVDNDIFDIDGPAAIELRANGGGAANPAVLEATVADNRIGELGDFAFAGLLAQVGGSALSGDFAELGLDLDNNVIDASGADYGGNAIYLQQVSSDAHFYFPGYSGSADGEYLGGSASEDLDVFLTANGNLLTNGGFPSFPGGVDAGGISGVSGDIFVHPVWP
ncbi:MAG TPA: Ig-like domain-containing protein [Allosphingosinicella sp.]